MNFHVHLLGADTSSDSPRVNTNLKKIRQIFLALVSQLRTKQAEEVIEEFAEKVPPFKRCGRQPPGLTLIMMNIVSHHAQCIGRLDLLGSPGHQRQTQQQKEDNPSHLP